VTYEGFHGRAGFGRQPALLVVDVNVGFTDAESPLVCDLDNVVVAIQRLLRQARGAGFPVVFTTVSYTEGDKRAASVFLEKVPALGILEAGSRWAEIDPRIKPLPEEAVLNKLFASAFFGTPLSSLLAAAGCDSVIVTGASTSGCVRATVVDALQHGYRPIVPRDAVGDRMPAAHEANLYDIDAKYGDVVETDDVIAHLEELAAAHAR
jgi:maleamate amidohydrolase